MPYPQRYSIPTTRDPVPGWLLIEGAARGEFIVVRDIIELDFVATEDNL